MQPYQIEIEPRNDMDRVWDTSKYPSKSFVTFCQMKVIKGQNFKKVILKILSLGWATPVFGSDFRQEPKNDPRTLFERFKSEK